VSIALAWEKIKLDEELISEVLVADTDSGSGSGAVCVDDYFSQKFFICWLNRPTCTTSNT